MGDFHNVMISVVEESGSGLVEHVEQLIFHSPVFVLWSGSPSEWDVDDHYSRFISAAHGSVFISGYPMGHVTYDHEARPVEERDLADDYSRNLVRGVSFSRQPFKRYDDAWRYSPKILVSPQFSRSRYETLEGGDPYEQVNYIGLFHVLLPRFWVPLPPSADNFGDKQGLLFAKKHLDLGRVSMTWGFFQNLQLALDIKRSEHLYSAFEGSDFVRPSKALKLKGLAKAAQKAVTDEKLGLTEFLKALVKEGILKGHWFL